MNLGIGIFAQGNHDHRMKVVTIIARVLLGLAAQDIKTNGTFNLLADNPASADLNELFRGKSERR